MLTVRVIGPMGLKLDGAAIETPANRREWALLAWLAINPGTHARAELAARFWPDVLDTSARASLRSSLWALRRALGAGAAYVRVQPRPVGLDDAGGLWVDALEFERLRRRGSSNEAVELGDGELLARVRRDVGGRRARWPTASAWPAALEQLARRPMPAARSPRRSRWTRAQVALDPLAEEPNRCLMSRLAAAGDTGAALGVYEGLRERLRRELGLAPSASTRRLAERLRDDAAVSELPLPTVEHGARVPALVGRDRELGELLAAWDTAARRRRRGRADHRRGRDRKDPAGGRADRAGDRGGRADRAVRRLRPRRRTPDGPVGRADLRAQRQAGGAAAAGLVAV